MSRASEIANNVWLGPTPDSSLMGATGKCDEHVPEFDVLVEASDLARPPDAKTLRKVGRRSATREQRVEFPASGSMLPPTWSHTEVDALLAMCHWMHQLANSGPTPDTSEEDEEDVDDGNDEERACQGDDGPGPDADGDIPMQSLSPRPRKILIHCSDGYTESSLLGVAYFMFAECAPVHAAWVRLHRDLGRNFFAYASDVALLRAIEGRLLQESPKGPSSTEMLVPRGLPTPLPRDVNGNGSGSPAWLKRMDGSLPSRVLDYMYLGNIGHANNPGLLAELGIIRVLSVGEAVSWPRDRLESWGRENLLFVDRVQDNGVDALTSELDRCLAFIGALSLRRS